MFTVSEGERPLVTNWPRADQRVLARQDGPTVLVGHSFSGMIVTEAGVHSKVSALVYVAARAPDAGADYSPDEARVIAAPDFHKSHRLIPSSYVVS